MSPQETITSNKTSFELTFEPKGTSPTLAINQRVNEMKAQGQSVLHLGFGECQFPIPEALVKGVKEFADCGDYLPVQGASDLREAIAKRSNSQISAEQLIVSPGSKLIIYLIIKAIQGDVILPMPSWVSYEPQAHLLNKQVFRVNSLSENNYCITASELNTTINKARADGANPKILILNSPCNPTGAIYPSSTLKEIATICKQHQLIVISDEIYSNIVFNDETFESVSQYYPEGTIVTTGISKDFSAGGYRLGWCILPEVKETIWQQLRSQLTDMISEMTSSVSAPISKGVAQAFGTSTAQEELDQHIKDVATLHGYRTRALQEELQKIGLSCSTPQGGFYLYLSFEPVKEKLLSKGIKNDQQLANCLLEECQLAFLPGRFFGDQPENFRFRLSSTHLDCDSKADAQALWSQWLDTPESDRGNFVTKTTHPQLFQVSERISHFLESL